MRSDRKGRSVILALLLLMCLVISTPTAALAAYNRQAAQDYSNQWWNGRNPNYRSFTADCQNFVSQCIHAGGIEMHRATDLWYHYREGSGNWAYTTSWINVPAFTAWGAQSGHLVSRGNFGPPQGSSCSNSQGGDVLHYDWESDGTKDHASLRVLDSMVTDPNSGQYGHVINQHVTDRYRAIWHLSPYNSKRNTTYIYLYRPQDH